MKGCVLLALISWWLLPATAIRADEVVHDGMTAGGHVLTMTFPDRVTMSSETATLCTDSSAAINLVKLWMVMDNGHEHGSTPTQLVTLGGGCFEVLDINFLMAGEWQMRISHEDGDDGVVFVEVARQ